MQSSSKCDNFNPQRFRPNFCKTCCKSKAEHISSSVQDVALRASLPSPIAQNVSQSFRTSQNLKKPTEFKKPPVNNLMNSTPNMQAPNLPAPTPSSIQTKQPKKRLTNRRRSIVNTNRIAKSLTSGYLAKQQRLGEIPNANKFFEDALRGLLSQGIGLSSNETEDLVRRVKASTSKTKIEDPIYLLDKTKTKYLQDYINSAQTFMDEQDELRRVIIVQSIARRFLVTKKFAKMTEEEMDLLKKRNSVYIGLIRTEREFVASIDNLISNFILRIRQSDVVAPHECAFIFSNIEVVAEEHRLLLRKLEAAGDNWPFIGNIGAIFLDIKSLLNAISVYVSNFKNAMNEIERLSIENPRFEGFIKQQADSDIDLQMSLTKPVNRIAQYEYILRSLADFTPEGSQHREDYENAFAVLAQSSAVVQTSLVQSGETARILTVQRTLKSDRPITLVKSGRVLIDEYKFKKHSVCLFNNIVVLARLPQQKGFSTGRTKQKEEFSRVKKISDLNNCSIIPSDKNLVTLTMEGETVKLHPLSTEKKMKFVQSFNSTVEELNRSKVFGVALSDTVHREKPKDGIPLVLKRCVQYMEENYLQQPGIFRVAGSKTETDFLKDIFDRGGEEAECVSLKDKNMHTLCDMIKSYLRSFPEPLLSFQVYDPLVQLMKNESNSDTTVKINKIKSEIMQHISKESLQVLRYLLVFLSKVCKYSDVNKMTASNLSIVFGPTFLWPKENSLESAMDMPYVNAVIQILLENPDML